MNIKSTTLLAAGSFLLLAAILQASLDQLYFMSAVVMATALVARVAVWGSVRGLRCHRQISDHVFEEDTVGVSLLVSNPSRLPKFFVALREDLSPWLETDEAQFLIPVLWPGQTVTLEYRAHATKRGMLPVGPLRIGATDPIGVFFRSTAFSDTSSAVVYPRPLDIPSHDLGGSVSFGGGLAERMARAGEGMDYHGVRDYKPGDELRRIHWKATARLQRLSVIEFQQSYAADIAIALDVLKGTDVGEGKETTLEYAVKIAATVARRAVINGTAVALAIHGKNGVRTAVCQREDDLLKAYELLAEAEADGEAPISTLLEEMKPLYEAGLAVLAITADADARLHGIMRFLESERVSLTAVLLDAPSFVNRSKVDADRDMQRTPQVVAGIDRYTATAEMLREAGSAAHVIRYGDDLKTAVRGIIGGADDVV